MGGLAADLCIMFCSLCFFFFQAEDGIRDLVRSRGLGDVYKRQSLPTVRAGAGGLSQVWHLPNLLPQFGE